LIAGLMVWKPKVDHRVWGLILFFGFGFGPYMAWGDSQSETPLWLAVSMWWTLYGGLLTILLINDRREKKSKPRETVRERPPLGDAHVASVSETYEAEL
jgi:hypothetical protein